MNECSYCASVRPEPEVCGHPDRDPDPRDDRTGWERPREAATCPCGRGVVVRGMCAYCLHAEHAKKVAS